LLAISYISSKLFRSLDGIIDQLIELNQDVGTEENNIGVIVSQIASAIKDTHEAGQANFANLLNRCSAGKELLTSFISKLEADKTSVKARSNDAKDANKQYDSDILEYTDQLTTANEELQASEGKIRKAIEAIRAYANQSEEKLAVIKQLRDIVTDEILNPSPDTETTSLIQLRTFNDKLHSLSQLLSKSKDSKYSPLVTTLLTIAETKGFSDKKMLRSILDVLKKLEDNLLAFRAKQEADGKDGIRNLKTQAKDKLEQIKQFAHLISQAKSTILDNENIIKSGENDVEHISRESTRKQNELAYWNKLCDYQDSLRQAASDWKDAFETKVHDVTTKLLDLNP